MRHLNDIPQRNNFVVPDGYFDRLPDEIMNTVRQNCVHAKPTIFQVLRPYIYAVACLATMVFGIKLLLTSVVDKSMHMPVRAHEIVAENAYDNLVNDLIGNDIDFYDFMQNHDPDFGLNTDNCSRDDELQLENYILDHYNPEYELFYE